jgi:class 3 adenylate cyclase
MNIPLSRKWNLSLYNELSKFVKRQGIKNTRLYSNQIPKAQTMPNLQGITIGSAKRMEAAIMFFDFEKFTSITSHLPLEDTLIILNISTMTVMKVVREWNGTVEKHTGDGVMAILGTETANQNDIAREAIETAQAIKYIMKSDVIPYLLEKGLPALNFRIGIEMGEILISRIGIHNMSFLTAVGSAANRASKLENLAEENGITIGANIAAKLHDYLHKFLRKGDNDNWDWRYKGSNEPYNYYHYDFEWPEPQEWKRQYRSLIKSIR